MPKSKVQKEQVVQTLMDQLRRMTSAVFVDYTGLNVKSVEQLRKMLRQEGVDYSVVKKTLLKLAFQKVELEDIDVDRLEGQIAVAIGYGDEILPSKLFVKFHKGNAAMKILGGVLDKKMIGSAEVLELSKILSRADLRARFLGSCGSPLRGMMNVFQGGIRNFIYLLSIIEEKKKPSLIR